MARKQGKSRIAGMDPSVRTLDQLLKALYELPSYRQVLLDTFAFGAGIASGIDTTRKPKEIAKRCFEIAEAMVEERARRE
jgi:hypothetical protein